MRVCSGQRDYTLTREQVLAHAAEIVAATDLPVARTSKAVSAAIRKRWRRRFAGPWQPGWREVDRRCHGPPGQSDLRHQLAVERVRAAAEVTKGASISFRADGALGKLSCPAKLISKTRSRGYQAYQEAGANVLYAPGLRTKEDIAAVVSSVDRPVNVLMPRKGYLSRSRNFPNSGSARQRWQRALTRALGAFLRAGARDEQHGRFTFGLKPCLTLRSVRC